VSDNNQPPWPAFGQQDPHQDQPQYPPPQPYGQQPYQPGQPPYGQQAPYTQPTQGYTQPTQGFSGQQPQPPYGPGSGRRSRQSWPARHKVLTALGGVIGLFVLIGIIGVAAGAGTSTKTATVPGPTVTVTQAAPAVTVTAPPIKVKVTVTPTANAQGQATQISDDGVYVVGQDIPGGTWHTSGGSQCYEASLSGTDTIHDIVSNNNFTGPDTVSLVGAKAFDISGGCTWHHEKS
jgi:hypothetical protein